MSVAAQLFDLQAVDLDIDGLARRQAAIEASLGDTEAVLATRAATAEAEKKLAAARAALLDAELALGEQEEHLAAIQRKLDGGSVHAPKELMNLQQNAESLARQKDHLESAALELMEQADEAQAAVKAAHEQQARAEAECAANQAHLRAEAATIPGRVAALTAQRNALAMQLPGETLANYDALRRAKAGHAVARLEHAACMGCGITLSSGEAQHLRSAAAAGLAYCPTCGRILFAGH
jgi:uncharacterized protein